MKHLKKLAALLLVGVLALSLLTACGGGGSTSADAQAETAVMAAINQNRPVNSAKLQNSSELRKIANQDLDAAISGKWGQLSSSFTFKSHTDLKNGKLLSQSMIETNMLANSVTHSLPSVITKIRTSQNLSKPTPASTATIWTNGAMSVW